MHLAYMVCLSKQNYFPHRHLELEKWLWWIYQFYFWHNSMQTNQSNKKKKKTSHRIAKIYMPKISLSLDINGLHVWGMILLFLYFRSSGQYTDLIDRMRIQFKVLGATIVQHNFFSWHCSNIQNSQPDWI